MIRNKKGSSVDSFFVITSFFLMVIFFIVILIMWNAFTGIDNFWDQNTQATTIKANAQKGIDTFDFILLMVYLGLHVGVLLTAFFLRDPPIFFILAFILACVLPLFAVPISNAYTDVIITDANIATQAANIPITNYIMSKLPLFEIIWALITIVTLFGFSRFEG